MRTVLLIAISTLISLSAFAQKDKFVSKHSQSSKAARNKNYVKDEVSRTVYVGPGFGLDYSGLGIKLEAMPSDWVGIFASGGTNFLGAGYNLGVSFKVLPKSKITPTAQGMYGYNGALIIKDSYSNSVISSKNYFGFSVGAGVDFTVGQNLNKLSVGIWVPIRNEDFKQDIQTANATVLPVALSLGFKFGVI